MRTCFLSNIDYLQNWVRAHWPEVDIFDSVPDHFEEYDAYLLSAYVKVNGRLFETQSAWQPFLATRFSEKKLGVIGNLLLKNTPYLQISPSPKAVEAWLAPTDVAEEDTYAKLPFQSILDPIGSQLLSHGEVSFQKLFFEFNVNGDLSEIETEIEEGTSPANILASEAVARSEKRFTLLDKRWHKGKVLFQFLPFFPALKEYESLRSNWNDFLEKGKFPESPLLFSQQVSRYLSQVVSAVTRFYRMEKNG